MRKMTLTVAAATLMIAGNVAANAQCKGKAVIDAVYQKATTAGKYEYFVQVRNSTSSPLTLDLAMGSFKDVTLFSPSLPGVMLAAHANKQIRFGTGTNTEINVSKVQVLYDVRGGTTKAYVSALNCK